MSTQHNNGWVATSERMPAPEDYDSRGRVQAWWLRYDTGEPDGSAFASKASMQMARITHWKRSDPPPETEEQKRARLDEEALAAIAGKYLGQTCVPYPLMQALRDVLAHARQPEARP